MAACGCERGRGSCGRGVGVAGGDGMEGGGEREQAGQEKGKSKKLPIDLAMETMAGFGGFGVVN